MVDGGVVGMEGWLMVGRLEWKCSNFLHCARMHNSLMKENIGKNKEIEIKK